MQQKNTIAHLISASLCFLILSCSSKTHDQKSLVPETPSNAPDYYCTWSIQGYVVNFSGADNTRAAINEKYMFGDEKYENWVNFFPKIRSDLFFVMDDSWDIPANVNTGNNEFLGLTELDSTRFPSFRGTPAERLKGLSDKVKSYGWKGLGGWICAQESTIDKNHEDTNLYWSNKLKDANSAGFAYWKVDWGKHDRNKEWRKTLTELGHRYAPNLYIEHAMVNDYIEFSDVFRTYDVESITSAPVTIQRISDLLGYKRSYKAQGIINCEDEPYIAIGLGCAIGIMRYPFVENMPNGEQDHVFPPVGRNLKKRIDEITRAVRWHRISEPFGVNNDAQIDNVKLKDYWVLQEKETWVDRNIGDTLKSDAPARVSRNMPLPMISNLHAEDQPFVLASKYPNGAVAIVVIDRILNRECRLNAETVSIEHVDIKSPVGIFGKYRELSINYTQNIEKGKVKIYGQDLAGDTPVDITESVKIKGNKIIVPGHLIDKVGLSAATAGDISAPGMVMQIFTQK